MANAIEKKSFDFAVSVVVESKVLVKTRREYVLSKQLLRSGTAIGALVREALQAESRADFAHKMSIALKEANETKYWLELLHQTGYLPTAKFTHLHHGAVELLRLLTSIIRTTRGIN